MGTAGKVAGQVEGRPVSCLGPWVCSDSVLHGCLVFSDILSSPAQNLSYCFGKFEYNFLVFFFCILK